MTQLCDQKDDVIADFDIEENIRDLTDDEVARFWQDGYVHAPSLMTPFLADEVLRRARELMGDQAEVITGGGGGDPLLEHFQAILRNFLGAWKKDPLLYAISHSQVIGRNASRLMRGAPVRFMNDEILVKIPTDKGGKATPFHQDFPHASFDRSALINLWFALVELPPEKGAMRFLTGSHRAGPMGRTLLSTSDVVEQYPYLLEAYPLSAPLHMHPGDATIHGDLTIHGGPANKAASSRWAYLVNVFDARARNAGGPSYGEPVEGVQPNALFDTPRYPLIHSGRLDVFGKTG
ncbi:phytanoyl-CoA dioxygenase family protein [Sphingobium sp. WCS2017Hpa-17]|uniref:phytanoyl-CoA dioxygenase family protein n=1 Tax=Sphingobium sp. WCS2017Hpa-17 TaxID=3073638 RepID=UPI00288A7954|nr:phytanoyl-CoA dioxygenase family protein [Sphingobium sp. WCS2017Hpa-17]